MNPPPPHRRGVRDIQSSVDRSSAPGTHQNAFWKLFKLEMKRLMAERELLHARQRAKIAEGRRAQAEVAMRGLIDDPRILPLVETKSRHAAASVAAPETVMHKYGAKRR